MVSQHDVLRKHVIVEEPCQEVSVITWFVNYLLRIGKQDRSSGWLHRSPAVVATV